MARSSSRPPAGLKQSGRALWKAVMNDFDLDEHEQQLLLEACRTRDLCDGLQVVLDSEGPMNASPQGVRVHPAAAELRQQRITFARLLAALKLPTDTTAAAGVPPVGAPRGVYGPRSIG